jgi:Tfp pilus assembly protein PilF
VEDHDAAERAMKRFRELSAQEEEEKQEMLMVRGSPDHRDTQMILAKRAKRTGDHQLARMFLRRALKIDPDFQPARNMLAEIEKPR